MALVLCLLVVECEMVKHIYKNRSLLTVDLVQPFEIIQNSRWQNIFIIIYIYTFVNFFNDIYFLHKYLNSAGQIQNADDIQINLASSGFVAIQSKP